MEEVTDEKIIEEIERNCKDSIDGLKNYEPRISQEWVQVLINLRMKHAKAFTRKRNSAATAWMDIYNEMKDLGAPNVITLEKLKKKWMNLIARFKHLKFAVNPTSSITWPYFDQIDRAYERNPNIIELRKSFSSSLKLVESDSDDSVTAYADTMMKRQQFTSVLIQLRCDYKHLFTGKKYAAQRGWMVVKNMHPNGENYTVDQFSKCWQNLTQRYRTLVETEKDLNNISWMHFPTMHNAMKRMEADAHDKTAIASPAKDAEPNDEKCNEFSDEDDDNALYDELTVDEAIEEPAGAHKRRRTPSPSELQCDRGKEIDAPMDDLLKYLIQRDIRLDEQHEQLMKVLGNIARKLNK